MKESNDIVEELICDDSFCKFVTNPDESTFKYWNGYIKDNPEKLGDIKEARKVILLLGNNENTSEVDERVSSVWFRIKQSLGNDNSVDMKVHFKSIKIGNPVFKVAAAVALLIGVYFVLSKVNFETLSGKRTYANNYFHKSVPIGQKSTVFLPDGSQVKMNAGTSIEYSEDSENNSRVLKLEGEAFFNVKRDTLRPFIVKTQNLSTTVLGTSFNVKAYKGEEEIEVALISGKVSLSNGSNLSDKPLILSPNEMVSYNKKYNATVKQTFESEQILAWTDKTLYFEDVNFEQLVVNLERWYGVKFVIDNNLWKSKNFIERKDYKGKYKNKSLETVLEAVGFSYGFDFEIDNKTVMIKSLTKKGGIN